MANQKLTALTALTTASDDDLLYIVDDPAGTPAGKKITVANFIGSISTTSTIGCFVNNTIALSTTANACPFKTTIDASATNFPWPEAGVLSNLVIRTSSTQSATGSMVATLYVNGVASTLVATVTAGGAGGSYADTTHTVTIAAGDVLRWVVVNNATATSANIIGITMLITKAAI